MNATTRLLALGCGLTLFLHAPVTCLASPGCGPLHIQRDGANVILTWNGTGCRLQEATELIACAPGTAWTDLPGGASPSVLPIVGAKKFFRTVSTNGGSPSPNIVAYVNLQLPSDPGGGSVSNLIANPLNGTNNFLDTILPDVPDGTTIYRFDVTTQNYRDTIQYIAGFGWFTASPDPNALQIDPGEGFWIFPVGPNPLTVTFVGEVPQGTLVNPLPGPGQFALLSSIMPVTAPIGDAASPCTLLFPAEDGDTVLRFDAVTQGFKEAYQYVEAIGWFSANSDDPGPLGPTIPVGMGFVLQKAANATQTAWVQMFGAQGGCPPADLPAITTQPQDLTVLECECATFTVAATGRAPLSYQWQRNGSDILGANSPSYTLCPVTLADNGAVFRVIITNECGRVTSRDAVLTVVPDLVPPHIVSVTYSCCDDRLYVLFNELLDVASATEPFNYSLSDGVTINSVTLLADGRTVCMEVSPLTPGTTYTLTVIDVKDCAGNVISPNPTQFSFTAPVFAKGYALRQWWFNVPGSTLPALLNLPTYPNSPDEECLTNLFELNPADQADNYGARITAWYCPPVSGNFHFYLAADNQAELYLSTDQSCANRALIAKEPEQAGRRDWTGLANRNPLAPENRSSTLFPTGIPLTAGQRYFIEGLVKEGNGSDHLAVAVQLPGDPPPASGSTPIPGRYLGVCVTNLGAIIILKQPSNVVVSACCTDVCFMVSATISGPCGATLSYQWQRNGVDIPGAIEAMYCLTNVTLADNGAQFQVVISGPGISVISQVATLTVVADVTPPVLISASIDCRSNKVTLVFDECLDLIAAGDAFSYTINGGAVNILNVTVSPDGKTVCLFTDPLVPETDYTIIANGLADRCGNTASELTVTLRCSCLDVFNEQVTCATNTPGKLNYSFDLQNLSGVPVKYLFLVSKDHCFEFMPAIITFSPPLADGQTTGVNVMILHNGNCPTNLCFILAAHNTNLVQCCSTMRCINGDGTGPRLVSAVPDCATNKITVTFSEPLAPGSFLGIPNFVVDDLTHLVSLALQNSTFGADFQTVCLYTAAPLSAGTQYRLTVNNVTDVCGNVIPSNSQVNFDCPGGAPVLEFTFNGGMLCVSWTGNAVLECTTSLSPPILWVPAANQSNPQCIPPGGPHKFFRLRVP